MSSLKKNHFLSFFFFLRDGGELKCPQFIFSGYWLCVEILKNFWGCGRVIFLLKGTVGREELQKQSSPCSRFLLLQIKNMAERFSWKESKKIVSIFLPQSNNMERISGQQRLVKCLRHPSHFILPAANALLWFSFHLQLFWSWKRTLACVLWTLKRFFQRACLTVGWSYPTGLNVKSLAMEKALNVSKRWSCVFFSLWWSEVKWLYIPWDTSRGRCGPALMEISAGFVFWGFWMKLSLFYSFSRVFRAG